MIQAEIESRELTTLALLLRQTADGKRMLARLRRELRREAAPAVEAARRAALSLPSKRVNAARGRVSLRAALAKATRSRLTLGKTRAGLVIEVSQRAMPEGMKSLPVYVEGLRRWRHPVYGQDVWVRQDPMPFFYDAVRPYENRLPDAGRRIIAEVEREITR